MSETLRMADKFLGLDSFSIALFPPLSCCSVVEEDNSMYCMLSVVMQLVRVLHACLLHFKKVLGSLGVTDCGSINLLVHV